MGGGVQNLEFQYLGGGGGVQKNEYCFGYEDFVDIFWVITKKDWFYGLFLCILGSFLKVKVQNGDIFGGGQNIKFSFVCLILQIFFWG